MQIETSKTAHARYAAGRGALPGTMRNPHGWFPYRRGILFCERVSLQQLAEHTGTPVYVYTQACIESALSKFRQAFAGVKHTLCYSVKANSNLAILELLYRQGAGFDIVSGGELFRLQRAGVASAPIVFSGVGKTAREIDSALNARILFFNAESAEEVALIAQRAAHRGRRARVALRINPDVLSPTHPHIATGHSQHKFGVRLAEAPELCKTVSAKRWLEWVGLGFHIGSQIPKLAPFRRALQRMVELGRHLQECGLPLRYLDIGGGIGIRYQGEQIFALRDYARLVRPAVHALGCHLVLEPGRAIVGPAGVLLTRVLLKKRAGRRWFVVVDAGMTDLLRPALYGARHRVVPIRRNRARRTIIADVVGPVCETTDTFAHGLRLADVNPGEVLAICDVGAYGFVMTSNYNSRPRPAEVLVRRNRFWTVRRRERLGDLVNGEKGSH